MRRSLRIALCVAGVCGAGPVAAGTVLDAKPGTFNSSEQCGSCHRDIFGAWKKSAHARAVEDPLFIDAIREMGASGGDVQICLRCHAPTVEVTKDRSLEKKISWEGVTCDYCHSIAAIGTNPAAPPTVRPGVVKFGPIRDALSSAHDTAFRDYYNRSEMCAGCHEYTNPTGLALLTTYSDWKSSSWAAQGKSCQDCHMFEVSASVVDPKVQRLPNVAVNLHAMPGGHTIEQLNKALAVKARVRRAGKTLSLDVDLTNVGAGHTVPTGSAARQILLAIRVDGNSGKSLESTRTYDRVLTDQSGVPLYRDVEFFSKAAKVKTDNRIGPGKTRSEHFDFEIGTGGLANVKLRLVYQSIPDPRRPAGESQVFYTQSWTVPPH
jgi:hypothetical protein